MITGDENVPKRVFGKACLVKFLLQKEDIVIGKLSVEYLGHRRSKNHAGEVIKFRGEMKMNQAQSINISRKALVVLSRDGTPLYYDTDGTGGNIELENLGDRVLVTTPIGQRFVRYAGKVDFFYEDFFPVHEWLGIVLSLSRTQRKSSRDKLICFSTTLLRALPYEYWVVNDHPLIISSNLGVKICLDDDLFPSRIDIENRALVDSIVLQEKICPLIN